MLFMLALTATAFSQVLTDLQLNKLKPIKCKIKESSKSRSVPNIPKSGFADALLGSSSQITVISGNWCGYASVTGFKNPQKSSVSSVSGAWYVPTVKASTGDSYSAIWAGIDGFTSNTVEQIGTEQDWYSGAAVYYAWFEMFPRGSYVILGFPVNPGDLMGVTVSYVGNGTFTLTIMNFTYGVYFTIPKSYTKQPSALRNSAEWIVEAPSGISGVLPLADFGFVNRAQCVAKIDGDVGAINDDDWKDAAIIMETSTGVVKAAPSNLTGHGEQFSVVWEHD